MSIAGSSARLAPSASGRRVATSVARRLIAACAVFLFSTARAAAPAVEVSSEQLSLDPFSLHVQLLEDSSGELTISEVSSPRWDPAFSPASLSSANVGFTDSAWWARFVLRNASTTPREVYLRQTYALIDSLQFYERAEDGTWHAVVTGDRTPFGTRPVAHRDFIFPISVPADSERAYYVRYQSQGPVDISLTLSSAPVLMASLSREQLAFGIYFGAVLMLLVWSGLVFVAVRDNAFFAYFAYVSAFGLYMLVNNGLAYQHLWPDSPRWGNTSLLVLLNLAGFAALQFSRVILRARDYTPRLDQVARALQLAFVFSLLLTPLFAYASLIVPLTALIMASVIFMLVLGTVCVLLGSRPARFYLLAWGFFLAGSIVFLLKTFGVLPHTFFTHNGWQLGALFEMILLSMTLSSRMNELKHESRTDSLTLLGNRRLFDDKLPTEFSVARALHKPLSLLILDIDHFKAYNDRHGHAQGDEAIKVVANAVRRHTRKPFIACRYGGEEFTLILPGADAATAETLAERLRANVQDAMSGNLAITISVGFASVSQGKFDTAEQLFEAADSAMYLAKQRGRNRIAAFAGKRAEDLAQTA